MKILFAIAVISFAALVWAALAIARHVRKNSARSAGQPAAGPETSEAIDFRLAESFRPPSTQPVPAAPSDNQQEFSYVRRDAASSLSDKDTSAPSKPATVDRS